MAGSGVRKEVEDLAFDASIAFDAGDIRAANRALEDIADAIDGTEVDEWLQRAYEVVSAAKKSTSDVRTKGIVSIQQTIEEALSVASSARDLGERALSGGDRVVSAAESLMDILNGDLDYNAYQDAESACGDLIDELNGVEVDPDEDFGDDGEEDPVSALQTELADLGKQFGAMTEDDEDKSAVDTKDFTSDLVDMYREYGSVLPADAAEAIHELKIGDITADVAVERLEALRDPNDPELEDAITDIIALIDAAVVGKRSVSGDSVTTKGTGYEEFRGCVGWLSAAIKNSEDMGADLGDAQDWAGAMFERVKYGPVSFTQDDVDTWSGQLDEIRSMLESALAEVSDEDETAKGKLPAQKRFLTEGLRQVDRAIDAIGDLEPDSEDEGKSVDVKGGAKPSKTGMRWAEENEYDLEEIASYIEDAADAQEDRAREEWGPDSDDPDKEMVSMLRNDAKDMRKLATAVRNGRLDDLDDLEPQDTAARDELPSEYYGLRDAWIDFQENGADEDYEESVGAVDTKTGSRSPRGVIEILERLYTLLEQSDDKLAMRETDDLITALTETSLNRETKPELAASIRELWDAFEDGSEEASLCSEAAEALGAINVDDYNGI